MYKGKLVFAQLTEHLPKEVFAASVARYAGKYPTLTFSYWDQFLCIVGKWGQVFKTNIKSHYLSSMCSSISSDFTLTTRLTVA